MSKHLKRLIVAAVMLLILSATFTIFIIMSGNNIKSQEEAVDYNQPELGSFDFGRKHYKKFDRAALVRVDMSHDDANDIENFIFSRLRGDDIIYFQRMSSEVEANQYYETFLRDGVKGGQINYSVFSDINHIANYFSVEDAPDFIVKEKTFHEKIIFLIIFFAVLCAPSALLLIVLISKEIQKSGKINSQNSQPLKDK